MLQQLALRLQPPLLLLTQVTSVATENFCICCPHYDKA
jgi:hypothetical protein